MSTSTRLEQALQKLYDAFNSGNLYPECYKQCAVGTILDGTDSWKHLSDDHGSLKLNYLGQIHESFGRRFNGYKPSELLLIEQTFLKACGFQVPLHHQNAKPNFIQNSDSLFSGLCEVIECLCELDHVPNVVAIENFTTLYQAKTFHITSTQEV